MKVLYLGLEWEGITHGGEYVVQSESNFRYTLYGDDGLMHVVLKSECELI